MVFIVNDLCWLAANLHLCMSAEHESIQRLLICTCILPVAVK